MSIEYFGDEGNPNAIVIRRSARVDGIKFFSPENYSQQLGLMTRPIGYKVPAHIHNSVERKIVNTQEVLLIRYGECLVTLFLNDSGPTHKIHLFSGDAILLAHGPHEIEMLTDCEILEVKQGPYAGSKDKTRFEVSS
jgi:hypothetical protein